MIGPMYPWRTGGVAVHVQNVARNLVPEDDIRVVTPGVSRENADSDGVHVRVARRFPVETVPLLPTLPEVLVAARWLRRASVLHVHDCRYALAARLIGCPLITTFHGYLPNEYLANGGREGLLHTLLVKSVMVAAARSAACIAVDGRIAAWLRNHYKPSGAVHVIPNGVDTDKFNLRVEPISFGVSSPIIFCGKHFAPKCGTEYAVRAMPWILKRFSTATLVLAGMETTWRDTCVRAAKELGVTDRVLFCGQVPHEQMPAYIAAADVCVVPSVPVEGVEEATSLFALESMACGKAVVASKIGGLRSIIENWRTGVLVPPGSPGAIAQAVVELLRHRDLRDTIGAAAREYVDERRSWPHIANEVHDIYESVRA